MVEWGIGIGAILLIAGIAYLSGRSSERNKQLAQNAEDRKNDGKISSKPFVDSPFSRMRPKD